MELKERRKHYKCGKQFLTQEQIPSWREYSKALRSVKQAGQAGSKTASYTVDNDLNEKVAVWYGDITRLELDCVVNSTYHSEHRYSCGGAEEDILTAAGKKLGKVLQSMPKLALGECRSTEGYKLPAKYVLHTVGPSRHFVRQSLWKPSLRKCYVSCLNQMLKLGQRTVAFSCLSTGAKDLPVDLCADVALTTVREWIVDNRNKVDKVIFCIYDTVNLRIYEQKMLTVFPTVGAGPSLPVEILRMDRRAIELYKTALEEGEETVYSIRVMIVGHFGVGKTTLARRLLGDKVKLEASDSTDGIDIHVSKCEVSLTDNTWRVLPPDKKPESPSKRLSRLLSNPQMKGKEQLSTPFPEEEVGASDFSTDEKAAHGTECSLPDTEDIYTKHSDSGAKEKLTKICLLLKLVHL